MRRSSYWKDCGTTGMVLVVVTMTGWEKRQTRGRAASALSIEMSEWAATQPCTLPDIMEMQCGCNLKRMALLQPGSRTDLLLKGDGLSKASILCQPTTLLCSNPERGVKRQRCVDRVVKRRKAPASSREKGNYPQREKDIGTIFNCNFLFS